MMAKNRLEIDCRKCVNCTGIECKEYGNDANKAVAACAKDGFKNYIECPIAGEQSMRAEIKIRISEEDILILKTDALFKQSDLEKILADIEEQAKRGVVTIPNGFTHEIYRKRKGAR